MSKLMPKVNRSVSTSRSGLPLLKSLDSKSISRSAYASPSSMASRHIASPRLKVSRIPIFFGKSANTTPRRPIGRALGFNKKRRHSATKGRINTARSETVTGPKGLTGLPLMKGSSLILLKGAAAHTDEFKTREKEVFKRFADANGCAPGTQVAVMLRSLGFYPSAKQVTDLLKGQESVDFKTFQDTLLDVEDHNMAITGVAAGLFVNAADWKNTKKIKADRFQHICCSFGEKMTEVEWKEFMLIVNPRNNEYLDYMDAIRILTSK